jgi:hypothetical protein
MSHWSYWASPDLTYVVWQITNGVMEFYRRPPPPGTTNQAVIAQRTDAPLLGGQPVVASFQLGNSSAVRKRISVLLHDEDFSDLSVCTFWLPAGAALATYGMETHTTEPWANLIIAFYAASVNVEGDTGFYELDNVSVQYVPAASTTRTRCIDPTAPAPPGGPDSTDLLGNGNFDSGELAPWVLYGAIQARISDGVFEFIKLPGIPAGVLFQATGQAVDANTILTATFDLGNSSTVRKRVTVILHDHDFSDLSACTFWLPPGQPLSTYTYRAFATRPWTNARLSVYPATAGYESWIQLDNVTLRRTPSSPTVGVECLEPGDSPIAQAAPAEAGAGSPATTRAQARPEGVASQRSRAAPREAPGARQPTGEWITSVTAGASTTIVFPPWLVAVASHAEVQVSPDGVTWVSVYRLEPSDDWRTVEIDLAAWTGETIWIRVVLLSSD